ncbi:hypothetical protein [Lysinibacillus fusiformis]|uniref:hypothetical protein n=1 Tax=Lysinibacillus fusiformis TaxID=28031 RepID=UPI0035C1E6AB|nr:hypothetical protein QYY55_12560 [Lysinibacillus fusiformis]
MKFKSFVKFLAGTVAIGAATVAVVKVLQKEIELSSGQHVENTNATAVNQLLNEEKNSENQTEGYIVKEAARIAIAERHEGASTIIKEALSNINNTEKQNNDAAFNDLTNNLEPFLK